MDSFNSLMKKFSYDTDKVLRRKFGKFIKGNFLIEMKHRIKIPDIMEYYDLSLSKEKLVLGDNENIDFDICRAIVGCHSSNTIFLDDEERVSLEKSEEYKKKLAQQVESNIRLRQYGSAFFRQRLITGGEMFLTYNVPYNLFVMAIRMNLLLQKEKQTPQNSLCSAISNKTLASLTLLEDNFLDNCYPICRACIELYLKLIMVQMYPEIAEKQYEFNSFEVIQSACSQEYSDEFNELFKNRKGQKQANKVEYLHYGWVDSITDYHSIVKDRPYSVNGMFSYFKNKCPDMEDNFTLLEYYYKMCHGFTHGNVYASKYPLLHYFEISTILNTITTYAYMFLCNELEVDTKINDIDIIEKNNSDMYILKNQYIKKSTELFEAHYKRLR